MKNFEEPASLQFAELCDELLDEIVGGAVADPTLCPILASMAGSYGPATINSQGDVFVEGDPQWDCAPYG